MNVPLERRVYTIEEVASMLGLSRNSAYMAARDDRLPVPVIRIGKRMMVIRAVLDTFLETGDDAEWRSRRLGYAARDLIALRERCPELFTRVLPISDTDMQTLRELAEPEPEDDDHAAE